MMCVLSVCCEEVALAVCRSLISYGQFFTRAEIFRTKIL